MSLKKRKRFRKIKIEFTWYAFICPPRFPWTDNKIDMIQLNKQCNQQIGFHFLNHQNQCWTLELCEKITASASMLVRCSTLNWSLMLTTLRWLLYADSAQKWKTKVRNNVIYVRHWQCIIMKRFSSTGKVKRVSHSDSNWDAQLLLVQFNVQLWFWFVLWKWYKNINKMITENIILKKFIANRWCDYYFVNDK